ncbi:hypothetical protein [Halorhabdus sp. SVX81]|uniref:hypothetical protein n=1 Tax=Halorhabdus sp. SVX81 TaxID=2978283 RepID=UPI0023DB92FA|nr:hypothetical protein [Halorhabdus sp. SVX81]
MVVDLTNHFISKISSPASIETIETYESELEFYRKNDYTYIPLPLDQKYVNSETEEVHDLAPQQLISTDAQVFSAMTHLPGDDFLLTHPGYVYGLEDGELAYERGIRSDFDQTIGWPYSDEGLSKEQKNELAELISQEGHLGIITLADMNNRATKEAIYPIVAELESIFARKIREELSEIDIIPYLDSDTIEQWAEAQREGLGIHISEFMSISDLLNVAKEYEEIRSKFGYDSKREFEETGGIVKLRNSIMHLPRPLIQNIEELHKTIERIERCKMIIEEVGGEVRLQHDRQYWFEEFPRYSDVS